MMTLPIRSFFLIALVMISVLLRATNTIESNSVKNTRFTVPGAYIVEFSPSFTRLQTSNHV
jgi:hypothetical protein